MQRAKLLVGLAALASLACTAQAAAAAPGVFTTSKGIPFSGMAVLEAAGEFEFATDTGSFYCGAGDGLSPVNSQQGASVVRIATVFETPACDTKPASGSYYKAEFATEERISPSDPPNLTWISDGRSGNANGTISSQLALALRLTPGGAQAANCSYGQTSPPVFEVFNSDNTSSGTTEIRFANVTFQEFIDCGETWPSAVTVNGAVSIYEQRTGDPLLVRNAKAAAGQSCGEAKSALEKAKEKLEKAKDTGSTAKIKKAKEKVKEAKAAVKQAC